MNKELLDKVETVEQDLVYLHKHCVDTYYTSLSKEVYKEIGNMVMNISCLKESIKTGDLKWISMC